ncbi:FMN-dependent NADH-azoreductase [Thiocapsa rosea]|uniref:FMN dependent NADH:quinone oxidoreductase n=1 Tax=Thiocapsa rosea TaxID=69360 RepID=A0A495VEI2_9GAMM|nr:NAD(P)H-dependent oxidoreductase [Thiocapsa rosea]RKT47230.1 FMN-dependent NADH-azoreductase [Thiocapsa rosea]
MKPDAESDTMNILQINASARREGANSTRIADAVVERLRAENPAARVQVRDLASQPHPVLDEAGLAALSTPPEQRTPEQAARVALDDALIAEVQAADAIVLGVPMYNFGVPAQLKHWIDAIARAGVTFRYTEQGPVGLLAGRRVYVALARGGRYRDTPADSQVPYLKTLLGFLGMTDVRFIYAEGLNMGPESAERGFAEAEADLEAAFA